MSRKGFAGWLVLAVTAMCSLPLILRLGTSCAAWYMAWCSAYPQVALLLAGLALFLVGGSLMFGVWAGISQLWRTARVLGPLHAMSAPTLPATLRDLSWQLGIAGRVDLVETPIPLAYCYGLLRPRVCITAGLLALLTPRELAAVLQHERAHLWRRDPLRAWIWTVCDGMCWWLPRAREEAQLRHELAADQAVIQAGGRQPLASAVLKLITYTHQQPTTMPAALAISTLSATEARIDQLLQPQRAVSLGTLSLSSRLMPIIGLTTLAVCLLTMLSTAA